MNKPWKDMFIIFGKAGERTWAVKKPLIQDKNDPEYDTFIQELIREASKLSEDIYNIPNSCRVPELHGGFIKRVEEPNELYQSPRMPWSYLF